ncbi:MAG: IS66 family transposase, partial [FCB group bacterium]|nr:IS66 family transposase [FCB group bacterium]
NDTKILPDDPEFLKQMIAELLATLNDQNKKIDRLQGMYDALVNQRYGRKSERLEDVDPELLLPAISAYLKELQEQEIPEVEPEPVKEEIKYTRKKPSGRKKLPATLERETIIHDIDDSEKACKCCGQELEQIGQEASEQLEYIPAKLYVIEHLRLKYACKKCQENVVIA